MNTLKDCKQRIFPLALAISALVLPASAIPILQLDIEGGTWVGGSEESTITVYSEFTLEALLTPDGKYLGANTDRMYYLSVAVTPKIDPDAPESYYGSYTIDGVNVLVYGDMDFGAPPLTEDVNDMGSHSIFDTYYKEHEFQFNSSQTTPTYNVQDNEETLTGGDSYLKTFEIDVSNLAEDVELHFDLYSYDDTGKKVDYFAPYSHDAGTGGRTSGGPGPVTNPVPECGATLALLGLGILGLSGFHAKPRSQKRLREKRLRAA